MLSLFPFFSIYTYKNSTILKKKTKKNTRKLPLKLKLSRFPRLKFEHFHELQLDTHWTPVTLLIKSYSFTTA